MALQDIMAAMAQRVGGAAPQAGQPGPQISPQISAQLMSALGLGGGAPGGGVMPAPGTPGQVMPAPGTGPSGMAGGPPPNPPAMTGGAQTGDASPFSLGGDGSPSVRGGTPIPAAGGGPRSNPGLMPSSSPQTAPQAGTYESGPKMAGDSQNTPTNREPTGENPQRPSPQPSYPPIQRNRFGALLMPQGGQVGGMAGAAPNPGQSFNWQNILNSFLQKRGLGGQPGGQPGVGGAPGIMGGGNAPAPY